MGALWDSHYDGTAELIELNPVQITWLRYPMKDNGRGNLIPDTAAQPKENTAWVRISRQKGGVHGATVASTGLTTNQTMFVLALHDVDLKADDIITANAGTIRKWKVGPVDDLYVEGECYAKQAPLVRADG